MKILFGNLSAIALGIGFGLLALAAALRPPVAEASPALTANGLVRTKTAPAVLPKTELAAFAAGCFWGVEDQFRKEKGVVATAVGFMGGHTPHPTYEQVCVGDTGHAETVEVEYDPKVVSYDHLLQLFWDIHDPTTPNRQGPDVGEQYRSVIFTFNDAQRKAALASRDRLQKSGELSAPIVTEIVAAGPFTKADEHHQQYVEKGGFAMCHLRKTIHRE
jgi:peptide-methionine (S)-S-oxide reductase